jgi:hypothetical protein
MDCFGIQPAQVSLATTTRRQFAFERSQAKVDAFMEWLEKQEAAGILEITRVPGSLRGLEEAWSDTYVYSAYARGVTRGRAELRRAGYRDVAKEDERVGGIAGVMSQPFHADRVGAMYTRTYEDLKSVINGSMNPKIRRTVADGLTIGLSRGIAEGKNPRQIARELASDVAHHVGAIGVARCRMIARTEVIRAHHLATIAEYRRARAEMEVDVVAELLTAGFDVCEQCLDLEARGPYALNYIEGMIPVHPNCRCCAIPVTRGRSER